VSAVRFVVAGLLVAGAVVVALLAADVRAWPAALESGDAVYDATPARASWTPSTRLGGIAEALLGVGADVKQRQALQLYSNTAKLHARLDNALEVQTARAKTQDALAAAARNSDPRLAAQARTLLGILMYSSAAAGGGQSQVDEAASDFTDAIRVAPEDDFAKFDLELLLRLSAAHGVRTGSGQSSGKGQTGRRGAGGGAPGSGY
jgi:hypothetical protein